MQLKKTILIAEDDTDLLGVVSDILKDEFPDAKVFTAINGSEALQKIQRQRFTLLITDMRMPKLDGGKLIETLAKMRPTERPMDVIVITGFSIEEKTKEPFSYFTWLEKPVERATLIKAVRTSFKKTENLLFD